MREIEEVLVLGKLIRTDDPRITEWRDKIDNLMQADPDEAHTVTASLFQLLGNVKDALRELRSREVPQRLNELGALANFSICGEGQALYKDECAPSGGMFTQTVHCGFACGAFRSIAGFAREAEKMSLNNIGNVPLEKIYAIEKMLEVLDISDARVGTLMGIAGQELLANGLLFVGWSPEIEVLDVLGEVQTVHITYRIRATAIESARIYERFIDRLIENEETLPRGFHISFAGTEQCL